MKIRLLACLTVAEAVAVAAAWTTPSLAEDQPTVIKIVSSADGPIFDQPTVTITAGQAIKWVAVKPGVPHHLFRGDPPADGSDPPKEDALTDQFMKPTEPVKKFDKGGTIKYFCEIHRATMIGTVTVKEAAPSPAPAPGP